MVARAALCGVGPARRGRGSAPAGVDRERLDPRLDCPAGRSDRRRQPIVGPRARRRFRTAEGCDPDRCATRRGARPLGRGCARSGSRVADRPGPGAAGGLGAALLALGATRQSGMRVGARRGGLVGRWPPPTWSSPARVRTTPSRCAARPFPASLGLPPSRRALSRPGRRGRGRCGAAAAAHGVDAAYARPIRPVRRPGRSGAVAGRGRGELAGRSGRQWPDRRGGPDPAKQAARSPLLG